MANIAKIPLVRQRREKVMKMLLDGESHQYIVKAIHNQYGVGNKSVQKDITLSYIMIRQSHDVSYEALVSRHIGMYYKTWQDATMGGDARGAIAALQAIEKLMKFHAPEQATFIQNNAYSFDHLSLEEVQQLLLEAKKDD